MHSVNVVFLNALAVHRVCAAASTSAYPANPTSPNYVDDVTWLTGYLTVHALSVNSYVYMFLFWFLVVLVFFALSCATWTEVRSTALGARWSKWALRRRTWRKSHTLKKYEAEARRLGVPISALHRQPKSLPSNAQIMTGTALVIIVLVICFVGPDYINPDLSMFQFSGSTSSTTTTTKRAKLTVPINDQTMSTFIAHYNIQKAWWTSAARAGGVAFALFPLVVALALKAPPFAVFGIPGLVQFGHDKMIRLHRYVGRLIWFVTLLHVLFWVVQVLKDRRETTGELVFAYVWLYQKFRFAWVAFLSMTILMITSLECSRNPHYELFYIVHVVCTPMTIIFSALHHPQRGIWGWCAAALSLWICERLWRACWWVYVNGVFRVGSGTSGNVGVGDISPYIYYTRPGEKGVPHRTTPRVTSLANTNHVDSLLGSLDDGKMSCDDRTTPTPSELIERTCAPRGVPLQNQTGTVGGMPTYPPLAHPKYITTQSPGAGPGPQTTASLASAFALPASITGTPHHHRFQSQPTHARMHSYAPPPGFAHATLLPGRTMRLRLVTPGYRTWAPGQHFLVGIPAVSRFTTHPFSIASVCDEQAVLQCDPDANDGGGEKRLVQAEVGRELVFLVRAKKGWTKRLWDLISSLRIQGLTVAPGEVLPSGSTPPPQGTSGVVLRTLVDGPFGSAGRTRWGQYSSVLIVSGGSGVSFGLSVLEYVCLCMAGRDGRFLGGFPGGWGVGPKGAWITQRVRFVWLVREYAHIQWCASSLRQCLTIVPTDAFELNIFVTNFRPPRELLIPISTPGSGVDGLADVSDDGHLKPPAPCFYSGSGAKGYRCSPISPDDSLASDTSVGMIVDSYFEGHDGRGEEVDGEELGHDTHLLDYTNFDGDDDTPMPGEHWLMRRIIKKSKMRRATSRKVESFVKEKYEREERDAAAGKVDPHAVYHAKTPSDEVYGGVATSTRRYSTHSTATLRPYSSSVSKAQNADTSGISPISPYRSFSALERQAHPQPQTQPSPLSFSVFGVPQGTDTTNEPLPTEQTRRFPVTSSMTLKSPSTSTSSQSAFSEDVKPWSGLSSAGVQGSGLALDPQEVRDFQIVLERALPGKPKLGRILADEVEAAKGRIAVACCGPTGLNALMRKFAAEQIDPARVARGDMQGLIDFIAEDFEY